MKNANDNNRGNALPLILVIVALVAAGIGGWAFLKKSQGPATDGTYTEIPSTLGDEDGTVPPQVPATEEDTATQPVDDEASSGPVTIDVDQVFAPRTLGNPDAPVKIIEYASLTCSHCAHFHNDVFPQLKEKYIDTGKVFFEFREFPLNDPALKATLTARCLPADQYENFVGLLFKTQDNWAGNINYMANLKQNAKLAGMSEATFDACQDEPNLKLKIAEGMQVAKEKWNIAATPTFIINDGAEIISGAQPLPEFERIFRKVTNDAVGAVPAVE